MKNKYNIVLLPSFTYADKIKKYASIFSAISDEYLLGEKSLPHLTLCQFRANPDEAEKIWKQVCDSLEQKSIGLRFKEEISCISLDGELYWISLLPESNENLRKMHRQVAKIVKNPINRSYNDYDPHITLVNTKSYIYPEFVKKLSIAYTPFQDDFVIAFGKSDEIGQFLEVIHRHELGERISCRL